MQINSYSNYTQHLQKNSPFQQINDHLTINEKQILRKELMQIPSKDLPKILQKIKQIPVDEQYLKNIINLIKQENTKKEGFEIYA